MYTHIHIHIHTRPHEREIKERERGIRNREGSIQLIRIQLSNLLHVYIFHSSLTLYPDHHLLTSHIH